MGNLFLSFTIAIACAVGLVVVSRVFDLEFYTNKILPLVPILYAIVYEVLDHRKAKRAKARTGTLPPSQESEEAGDRRSSALQSLSFGRIVTDVGVSFVTKFSIEMFLVALFLRFSGQSFTQTYGVFSIETVGKLLRGEHPWLAGSEGVYLLAIIALITCFITGLWIGYTSKGNAILEGVLAGAAVSVLMAMTNMLVLFRMIEDATIRFADSMGYVMRAGFLVVIALQVLLYGLWSGLVQMGRLDREKQAAVKRAVKKAKK